MRLDTTKISANNFGYDVKNRIYTIPLICGICNSLILATLDYDMKVMFERIIINIIICPVLTIVIEYIPIVFFLQIPKKYFIAVNVLTNVVANVILISYDILNANAVGLMSRMQLFIGLECIVCITEIYLYYIYYKKRFINDDNRNCCCDNDEVKCENQSNTVVIKNIGIANLLKIAAITILANLLSVTIGGIILDKLL